MPPAASPLKAYPNASYVVVTAFTAAGPFHVRTQRAAVAMRSGGDFALLVVDRERGPAEAYIAYDAWENNHRVSIELLDQNFTDSLGSAASTGPISASGNEAPILFHRHGWFYLLFGPTCCF